MKAQRGEAAGERVSPLGGTVYGTMGPVIGWVWVSTRVSVYLCEHSCMGAYM